MFHVRLRLTGYSTLYYWFIFIFFLFRHISHSRTPSWLAAPGCWCWLMQALSGTSPNRFRIGDACISLRLLIPRPTISGTFFDCFWRLHSGMFAIVSLALIRWQREVGLWWAALTLFKEQLRPHAINIYSNISPCMRNHNPNTS